MRRLLQPPLHRALTPDRMKKATIRYVMRAKKNPALVVIAHASGAFVGLRRLLESHVQAGYHAANSGQNREEQP